MILSSAQITAGTERLENSATLKAVDVDMLISAFRMFIDESLEDKYGYEYETKLTALNDSEGDDAAKLKASQIAACLIEIQSLGFGAVQKEGGKTGTKYDHLKEIWQYAGFAFSKIYPIPVELSTYDMVRARVLAGGNRVSGTIRTSRSWC